VNSLEFIHPAMVRFGSSANWSFLDGKMEVPRSTTGTRTVRRLLGQPDEIRNLSLFYTAGALDLRAAYNWTGKALRGSVPAIRWRASR
jgi:hypothetical protein